MNGATRCLITVPQYNARVGYHEIRREPVTAELTLVVLQKISSG